MDRPEEQVESYLNVASAAFASSPQLGGTSIWRLRNGAPARAA